MPGSNEEYLRYAIMLDLPADFPAQERWADGTAITEREGLDVLDLRLYHIRQLGHESRRARRRPAQKRALQLLRRYLSPLQADRLRKKGDFYVTLPSGNSYRLDARRGRTEEVTRHGDRFYVRRRFCLHEPDPVVWHMPPADLILTHLLWLLADEQEFLREANATDGRDMMWNGPWQRRLRAARLERQA